MAGKRVRLLEPCRDWRTYNEQGTPIKIIYSLIAAILVHSTQLGILEQDMGVMGTKPYAYANNYSIKDSRFIGFLIFFIMFGHFVITCDTYRLLF